MSAAKQAYTNQNLTPPLTQPPSIHPGLKNSIIYVFILKTNKNFTEYFPIINCLAGFPGGCPGGTRYCCDNQIDGQCGCYCGQTP